MGIIRAIKHCPTIFLAILTFCMRRQIRDRPTYAAAQ